MPSLGLMLKALPACLFVPVAHRMLRPRKPSPGSAARLGLLQGSGDSTGLGAAGGAAGAAAAGWAAVACKKGDEPGCKRDAQPVLGILLRWAWQSSAFEL